MFNTAKSDDFEIRFGRLPRHLTTAPAGLPSPRGRCTLQKDLAGLFFIALTSNIRLYMQIHLREWHGNLIFIKFSVNNSTNIAFYLTYSKNIFTKE